MVDPLTSLSSHQEPWIHGAQAEAAEREPVELTEPATDAPLATVAQATLEDVEVAVAAAREALEGAWARLTPTRRSRLLHGFADLVDANADELADIEVRNVGKALGSVKAEIVGAAETLRFYASAIGAHGGRSGPLGASLMSYSLKEPVGVCAQIVPWNYPLLMSTWKLAPALAAGCTIVLKPATQTPLTALALARLAHEAGIPPGVLNVLPGPGATVGRRLASHPLVDKVAFTGSTEAGSEIMRLGAKPIKRLTLELGGKSPNIVFADADLDDAIPSSCWSIFYAAGQSCEARSRILVERSVYDAFVERFVETAGRIVVGDPFQAATQVGSMISTSHRQRVHAYVELAVAGGATLALGGELPSGPGAFYPPTVLTDIAADSRAVKEEIFGPVVVIMPFDGEDEAAARANDTPYGLFATVWTGDPARGHRLARRIKAGMVGLNTPYTAFPGIGFGGYKQSGFGRELSLETLDLYSETKSVLFSTGTRPANPFRL